MTNISSFVKYQRKRHKFTQADLANKAGVGIRFIRELEQGKETLRLDKVNQVLSLFGFVLSPAKEELDPYEIALTYFNSRQKSYNNPVRIILRNKTSKYGFFLRELIDADTNRIYAWKFITLANSVKYRRKQDDSLTEIILHSDIQKIEKE